MAERKKKFVSRTPPTGRVPAGARPVPPREVVSPQTVKAWRVKIVFIQERGRWESLKAGRPVVFAPPAKWDGVPPRTVDGEAPAEGERPRRSVWQKVVVWCEANGLPPELYVRDCFANTPITRDLGPSPEQLLGPTYLKRWKDGRQVRRNEIRVSLARQVRSARTNLVLHEKGYGMEPELAQLAVLADCTAMGLSPLFCYCLAVSIGTPRLLRLATRLKARAVLQFETNRALYKKFWAEFLPPGFARESKELYPHLLTKLWEGRRSEPG